MSAPVSKICPPMALYIKLAVIPDLPQGHMLPEKCKAHYHPLFKPAWIGLIVTDLVLTVTMKEESSLGRDLR